MQIITQRPTSPTVCSVALLFASASFALAQTATPPVVPTTAAKTDQTIQLGKFEVTDNKNDGLHNKTIFRTDEEAPLAFNVIDRIEIERMGVTNVDEIFRNVTEVTNYGTNLQRETVQNGVTGGTPTHRRTLTSAILALATP
jgi:hypothetical protein